MPRPRKSSSRRRRGSSKLIKEMEKLAAALDRNAAHQRGHPFGYLTVSAEIGNATDKFEAA